jgi:myo-inositol-1(or 4)-monophosphatase
LPAAEPRRIPASTDLELLASVGKEAGALALTFFGRNPKTWVKANDSPVSDADIAVDRLLSERLRAARPDYGWLSEETADDSSRRGTKPVFIVDPIDGTREFLAGRNGWAVSLAVVMDGRPIAAALVAPAMGETFLGGLGEGATLNGERIAVNRRDSLVAASLAGPRRYLRGVAEAALLDVRAVRFVGSLAYRLALVAAGRADVAAAREGSRDWDLAAADLLVHEAGGVLSDLDGRTVRYDRAETEHPPLVATSGELSAEVRRLISAEIATFDIQQARFL